MFGKFKLTEIKTHIDCTSSRYDGKYIIDFPFVKVGYCKSSNENYSLCVIYDEKIRKLETVVVKSGKIIAKGEF